MDFSPIQAIFTLQKIHFSMARSLFFFLFLSFSLFLPAQDKPAYQIFNKKGKPVQYQMLEKAAKDVDVILFGELHNNPIAHWLQYELAQSLLQEKGEALVLGAEMFEADDQLLIDEYFAGIINTEIFEKEARLWNNYTTDYKPLLEMAKAEGLAFIATNIPRRYANLAYRKGFEALDSLSPQAKTYMAPLPFPYDPELPAYKNMLDMMGGHGGGAAGNFPKAQASKDATMAYFISQNRREGQTFIHFNGSYHSDSYEGINWYLQQYEPQASRLTITTVEQEEVEELEEEHLGKADFTIVVDGDMTKTY